MILFLSFVLQLKYVSFDLFEFNFFSLYALLFFITNIIIGVIIINYMCAFDFVSILGKPTKRGC